MGSGPPKLGLCFCMTILVTQMGVSAALGAFMMGSFIAETQDGERLQRLVKPVKDLFGAIFFLFPFCQVIV